MNRTIKDKASIDDIVDEVYRRIVPKLGMSCKTMLHIAAVRNFKRRNLDYSTIENYAYFWINRLSLILYEPMYPPGISEDQRYYIITQILLRLDTNKPSGWHFDNLVSLVRANNLFAFMD